MKPDTTTMPDVRHTVRHPASGAIVGWVHAGGCGNPGCKASIRAGRAYHAIPHGATLPDYHFATQQQAIDAVVTNGQPATTA